MVKGYVYILSDDTHPYLKIGRTTRTPEERIKELASTGSPGRLSIVDSILVDDCVAVESAIHMELNRHRVRSDREFFDIAPNVAVAYLRTFEKRTNINPPGNEEALRCFLELTEPDFEVYPDALKQLSDAVVETRKYEWDAYERISDTGHSLYETYKESPTIASKLLDAPDTDKTIGFKNDSPMWEMRLAKFLFVFEGSDDLGELANTYSERGAALSSVFAEYNPLIEKVTDAFTDLAEQCSQITERNEQEAIQLMSGAAEILAEGDCWPAWEFKSIEAELGQPFLISGVPDELRDYRVDIGIPSDRLYRPVFDLGAIEDYPFMDYASRDVLRYKLNVELDQLIREYTEKEIRDAALLNRRVNLREREVIQKKYTSLIMAREGRILDLLNEVDKVEKEGKQECLEKAKTIFQDLQRARELLPTLAGRLDDLLREMRFMLSVVAE
jgi:hypothetical protein